MKRVSAPPVVDGDISDPAYQGAQEAEDFILMGGRKLATQKTVVKAVWCEDTLYLAVKLHEARMPLLRKLRTKDNDSVWTDDCFEIYIDPGHTRKKAFQLVMNPNGAKQDTSLKRRIDEAGFSDLKLTWKTAVKLHKDYWTLEAAIPLKLLSFQEVVPGTVWGVNFCRSEIPFGEKSYWNNTGEYFLRPERYAVLHFGDAPGNPQTIEMDAKKGELKVQFAPKKPKKVVLSGTIQGTGVESRQEALVTARENTLAIPVSGKERKYTVNIRLASEGKETVFASDVRNYRDGLLSCLWPSEERGNRLPILYGTAQHAFWLFANHTSEKVTGLRAELLLPEGLVLLDPTTDVEYPFYRRCRLLKQEPFTRDGKAFVRHTIAVEGTLGPCNIQKLAFHQGICIYIECRNPAFIGKKLPVYTRIYAGELSEEENLTWVEILPEKQGIVPKKLVVHNWLWTWYPYTGCLDAALRTQHLVGFNSIEAGGAQFIPGNKDRFKKYNLTLINNMWWEFHGKAEGAQAVKFDGSKDNAHLCPTAMLAENGALLLKNRSRQLEDIRGGSEGIVWDLEGPYCWNICFCPKCIDAFRKHSGIAADVNLAPAVIREKYNREWIRFCCHQSTEICRILRTEFRKINPKAKYGFYSGLPSFDTMESYRTDWYDAIGDIDLALLSYYTCSFGSLDEAFISSMQGHIRKLKAEAAKRNNPNLKVWATLTPGYGRNSSMAPSAELVKLKVLRSFASGMDGVSFWWWGPFDGDYYQRLAEATTILGKYEPFFLAGESSISLKPAPVAGKRFSSFSSKEGKREFLMLMNHSSAALELTLQNPKKRKWQDEINGKNYAGGTFAVRIAPHEAMTLISVEK